jgi:hypothetical protein
MTDSYTRDMLETKVLQEGYYAYMQLPEIVRQKITRQEYMHVYRDASLAVFDWNSDKENRAKRGHNENYRKY